MNIKYILSFVLLLTTITVFSQENFYTSLTIPENLLKNANAVVRSNTVDITLRSINAMHILEKRIVTVLNKEGDENVDAFVYYDGNERIVELQALVFDAYGKQIKKIKKKDFKDVSAVSGGTLYSDSRVKYLEYTPISYPYTIEFICETVNSNTGYIQSFSPINDHYLSVENSSYSITYPQDINLRTKEKNFENLELIKEELDNKISYKIEGAEVFKPEDYSPSFSEIVPKVLVATSQFNYEGVKADVSDWNSMGKWFNDNLLKGRNTLSQGTISLVKNLINDNDDDITKAKKIYQFVQDNTRYINVSVGIGGMQPISAINVDRVKYGDCKGLTNYTKSLLDAVGVKSYYTRLYASTHNRLNVDKEFVSFQGQTNHVILNIPQENDEDIWLECTSQKLPFGFIGDFTDDRDVLVITPEGGKIKHTKKYEVEESLQTINGVCNVSNTGDIEAEVKVVSKGIQYDDKYWLETETNRDLDVHYKKRWKYINGLSINKMNINNDKDKIEFIENISFKASNYSKILGERMLLPLNSLNRNTHIPDRYRDRKLPLQIKRGFKDVDKVEIKLPENYKIESQPKDISIENKYGSYKMKLEVKDESTLVYNREFIIKDGDFSKEDYSGFRDFYKEVSKKDNTKIALIKK